MWGPLEDNLGTIRAVQSYTYVSNDVSLMMDYNRDFSSEDISSSFFFYNQWWHIRFQSHYQEYDASVILSVTLTDLKENPDVIKTADNPSSNEPPNIVVVSILNDKNEKVKKYSRAFEFTPQEKFSIGCFYFKSEEEFISLLVNGRLQLQINLAQLSAGSNYQNWEKLEGMHLASKFSDVKILTKDGKELAAHKIILASRVPYFERMFECNMKESTCNTVEMADIGSQVLQELLRFVYTGKVENIGDVVDDLIIAADKYLMEDLKNHCEKYLCDSISVKSAWDILVLAHKCNAIKLKAHSIKFVKENLAEIIQSNKFGEVTAGDCTKCEIFGDILRAFTP